MKSLVPATAGEPRLRTLFFSELLFVYMCVCRVHAESCGASCFVFVVFGEHKKTHHNQHTIIDSTHLTLNAFNTQVVYVGKEGASPSGIIEREHRHLPHPHSRPW